MFVRLFKKKYQFFFSSEPKLPWWNNNLPPTNYYYFWNMYHHDGDSASSVHFRFCFFVNFNKNMAMHWKLTVVWSNNNLNEIMEIAQANMTSQNNNINTKTENMATNCSLAGIYSTNSFLIVAEYKIELVDFTTLIQICSTSKTVFSKWLLVSNLLILWYFYTQNWCNELITVRTKDMN